MRICDIMSDRVISVEQTEPVTAAARLLKQYNIGAVPVCDGKGRLQGILTDRDIVTRCIAPGLSPTETRISQIMSRGVISAEPFEKVDRLAGIMSQEQIRRVPVTDQGKLVGMVSLCDMARNGNCEMEASEALAEISSSFRAR